MNELKILAYSLLVFSIVRIGMLYFLKELSTTAQDMEMRYNEMRIKVSRISTFEDSLMGNPDFRKRILDTISTKTEFDEIISRNRTDASDVIIELEELIDDRQRLGWRYNLYKAVDSMLSLLISVTIGLIIYFWIKSRN